MEHSIDGEKVIKGLERCSKHDGSECPHCPYFNGECTDDLMADALALLKELAEEIERLKTSTAGDNHIPLRW